jgi:WD40 repeat protein
MKATTVITLCLCVSVVTGRAQAKPSITALAVTPDGKGCVHGSQAGVFVRLDDGAQRIATECENVCALAFAPDGSFLAIAGGTPGESGLVEIYSWPARQRVARMVGHTDLVHAVAWLPDGKSLATASADRSVRLWLRETGTPLATLSGHSGPVLALALSPDGNWLCSGSADATIRVWSVPDKKLVRSLNNHLGAVTALSFRPAKEDQPRPYLASASLDGTVRIWQPTIGRMVRIVRHPGPVVGLCWERDGSHLASAAQEGKLRRIDGDSDTVVAERKLDGGRIASLVLRPGDNSPLVGHADGSIVAAPAWLRSP